MPGDAALVTAAVYRLDRLYSERWPLVAAHLLGLGFDGPDLLALACLSPTATSTDVELLVPGALAEVAAPTLTVEASVEVLARLVAAITAPGRGYPIRRALAPLATDFWFAGLLARAFEIEDSLDYLPSRDPGYLAAASAFEAGVRALPRLDLPRALAEVLVG